MNVLIYTVTGLYRLEKAKELLESFQCTQETLFPPSPLQEWASLDTIKNSGP